MKAADMVPYTWYARQLNQYLMEPVLLVSTTRVEHDVRQGRDVDHDLKYTTKPSGQKYYVNRFTEDVGLLTIATANKRLRDDFRNAALTGAPLPVSGVIQAARLISADLTDHPEGVSFDKINSALMDDDLELAVVQARTVSGLYVDVVREEEARRASIRDEQARERKAVRADHERFVKALASAEKLDMPPVWRSSPNEVTMKLADYERLVSQMQELQGNR